MKRVIYWSKDIEIDNARSGYVVGWREQDDGKQVTVCSCIVADEETAPACATTNELERQKIDGILSNIPMISNHGNSLDLYEPPCIVARWYRCRSDALKENDKRENKKGKLSAADDAADGRALPIIVSRWWLDLHGCSSGMDAGGILVLYTPAKNNMEHYASSTSTSVKMKTVISRINSAGDYADVLMSGLNSKSTGGGAADDVNNRVIKCSVSQLHQDVEMEHPNNGENKRISSSILSSLAQRSFFVSHIVNNSTPLPRLLLFRQVYLRKGSEHHKLAPRKLASERHLDACSILIHSAFDVIIGAMFGCALLLFLDSTRYTLFYFWQENAGQILKDYIAWLDRFPLGFKLNVPLTRNMNRESLRVVFAHDEIAQILLPLEVQKYILSGLALIAILLGGSSFIAAVIDIYRIATLHVRLLGNVFRAMWAGYLALFSSLWKLFRGKKKNILRHRTDTMEYDFMQLLLGVLMFTIVTFLFTTILVYFGFFGLVHLASFFGLNILYAGYSFIHHIPLLPLVTRLTNPRRFPFAIKFENVKDLNDEHLRDCKVDVLEMVSLPDRAASFVIKAYARSLKVMLSCVGIFFGELISGKWSSADEVNLLFSNS